MQLLARHVRTSAGTKPSCVTRADATNSPNGRSSGEPCTARSTLLRKAGADRQVGGMTRRSAPQKFYQQGSQL